MIDTPIYDIAIIGGGLGGLTFALQAIQQGYSVALFEKETYPFHKVCGEYISLESWNFLTSLGVPLDSFKLPIIKHLLITDVLGNNYSFNLPLGGFGISRFFLDNYLYQLCIQKGVDVYQQTKVNDVTFSNDVFTISTQHKTIQSKIAIGSFGKRSNVDVKFKRSFALSKPNKLNNFIGVKYHVQYNIPSNQIALYNFKNGYCGISKIEDNKVCVCYITSASNLNNNQQSIQQMEELVLSKNPFLKKIFADAYFLYDKPLSISQINFQSKSKIENHIFCIGDAAGLIAPLCGNGMSMAMHSSKIAFNNVHLFLQGEISRSKAEQQYILQWNKQFKQRLFIGKMVQYWFGNNTLTICFLRIMKALPFLAKWVIKSTHGQPF